MQNGIFMHILDYISKEAMRIHSAVPIIGRTTTEDIEIGKKNVFGSLF